jgi:hypothetical protein
MHKYNSAGSIILRFWKKKVVAVHVDIGLFKD